MSVFCKDCANCLTEEKEHKCKVNKTEEITYFEVKESYKLCSEINANNNCGNFEDKKPKKDEKKK